MEDLSPVKYKKRRIKITVDTRVYQGMKEIAEKERLPFQTWIRKTVLSYIEKNPLKQPPVLGKGFDVLSLERQEKVNEAIVYTVRGDSVKIAVSKNPDGGWRGIMYHPGIPDSMSAWTSENLAPPLWAKRIPTLYALVFIASRINDENDDAWFDMLPNKNFKIMGKWDGKRFSGGWIMNMKTGHKQSWEREGCIGIPGIDAEGFSANPRIHQMINMLSFATMIKDGGLRVRDRNPGD